MSRRPVAGAMVAALAAASLVPAMTGRAAADVPRVATGSWGPVLGWPIIPIHMVMTHDGRILTYGSDERGRQTGYLVYDVYDPATGHHDTLPNHTNTDIFCATQVTVGSAGEILIAGGDQFTHDDTSTRPTLNHGNANTTVFDPATDGLAAIAPMHYARWYGTEVVLPDGRVLVVGGTDHDGTTRATVPEVWDPATRAWSTLPGAEIPEADWYYPKLFVMPNGKVFAIGTDDLFVIDPDAASRDPRGWWRMRRGSITTYGPTRGPGPDVRHNTGFRSTAVMYQPGLILQVGGGSTDASIIDIRDDRPIVTPTTPMTFGREWPNSTVLPDGTVLVTGGSSKADDLATAQFGTIYRQPELWSPVTGRWTTLPPEAEPRLYHSAALLLADGSVMTGGGGAYKLADGLDPSLINHLDAQVFTPSYVQPTTRPVIRLTSTTLAPGEQFSITTTGAVDQLVLIKLPSVTHSFNNEQRFVPLQFTIGPDGHATATAPPDTNVATPGFYYLFALSHGVPSRAVIVAFATTA